MTRPTKLLSDTGSHAISHLLYACQSDRSDRFKLDLDWTDMVRVGPKSVRHLLPPVAYACYLYEFIISVICFHHWHFISRSINCLNHLNSTLASFTSPAVRHVKSIACLITTNKRRYSKLRLRRT